MATTTKRVAVRRDWTRDDVKKLNKHSVGHRRTKKKRVQ